MSFLSKLGNENPVFYYDCTEVKLNDIVFWEFGARYPFIPVHWKFMNLKLIASFVTQECGLNLIPMVDGVY